MYRFTYILIQVGDRVPTALRSTNIIITLFAF